jgi:hypothetical protein
MFTDDLLEAFIRGFYGYGTYLAPLWFVGMEEGGGNDLREIEKRLDAWDTRGRLELEDLPSYHTEIGITSNIGPTPKLQTTWTRLVRVFLASQGAVPESESIRTYQGSSLGTSRGQTCLVELLPLPSPDAKHWHNYSSHSALPYLKDRATYEKHVRPHRIVRLQEKLREHTPRWVVFYGSGTQQMAHWKNIAEATFGNTSLEDTFVAKRAGTIFVAMKHPARPTGIPNEYFDQVGSILARG